LNNLSETQVNSMRKTNKNLQNNYKGYFLFRLFLVLIWIVQKNLKYDELKAIKKNEIKKSVLSLVLNKSKYDLNYKFLKKVWITNN
jgi:hypothetical protein